MIMFEAFGNIHVLNASEQRGTCVEVKGSLTVCRQIFCPECSTPNYECATPVIISCRRQCV